MSSKLQLQGLNILVTRPKTQAQGLGERINKQGGHAILFPTLEIVPLIDQSALTRTLKHLAKYHWAIFTSSNAVKNVMPNWPAATHTKIAAIGTATANAITQFNIHVDACPKQEFSSEGLLALPVFQQIKDQQIVIFTGENGRDLLKKELTARGAEVAEIAVYRRQPPKVDITALLPIWQQQGINLIVSTSNESLTNLVNLIPETHHSWLLQIPLLVISPRMQSYAQELGFTQIIVATKASETEIFAAIKSWYTFTFAN